MLEPEPKSNRGDQSERGARTTRSLNLTMGGVTLLGVILGIGVSVGFGLSGAWWVRLGGGLLTVVVLVTIVKLTSTSGRGALARAANWIIGAPGDQR